MLLTCAACKAPLKSGDKHRNRYDETICRACRASGIRFTWPRRLRHRWARAVTSLALVLGAAAALALLAWWFELLRVLGAETHLAG